MFRTRMVDSTEQIQFRFEWRQGCLVAEGDYVTLDLEATNSEKWLVVSQSCDLLNPSLLKEPLFEVLSLIPIDKSDSRKDNQNLINPRELHIEIFGQWWKVFAFSSKKISRKLLENLRPDNCIDAKSIDLISKFMARRYWRIALADEFNRRIANSKSEKKRILESQQKLHDLGVDRILIHKSNLEKELEEFLENDSIVTGRVYKVNIIAVLDGNSELNYSIEEISNREIERKNELRLFAYLLEKRPTDQYGTKESIETEASAWLELTEAKSGVLITSEPQILNMEDISLKIADEYFIWDSSSISILNDGTIPEP